MIFHCTVIINDFKNWVNSTIMHQWSNFILYICTSFRVQWEWALWGGEAGRVGETGEVVEDPQGAWVMLLGVIPMDWTLVVTLEILIIVVNLHVAWKDRWEAPWKNLCLSNQLNLLQTQQNLWKVYQQLCQTLWYQTTKNLPQELPLVPNSQRPPTWCRNWARWREVQTRLLTTSSQKGRNWSSWSLALEAASSNVSRYSGWCWLLLTCIKPGCDKPNKLPSFLESI